MVPFHDDIDLNSNKVTNLANGTNAADAVNKSQLDAQAAGRLLGYFQVTVTENQSILAIPSPYQSKGFYQCFTESLLVPPQYVSASATQLTINSTSFYVVAGTVTVFVYS
jgi:hypothetical protein